jgi:hypothetical protein
MAIPFKISTGAPLSNPTDAAAAATAQEVTFGGTTSPQVAVVAGGDTTGNLSKGLRGSDTTDDQYNDETTGYSVDYSGNVVTTTLPTLSDSRAFPVSASVFNGVLIAGGQDEKGVSDVVDLITGQKHGMTTEPLKVARTDLASFSINEYAVFVGGNTMRGATNTMDIYGVDFRHELGVGGISFLRSAYGMMATDFKDCGVVAGGRNSAGIAQADVNVIDCEFKQIYLEPLSVARYNGAAAVAYNPAKAGDTNTQFILFAGGKNQHDNFLDTIDVYDASFNKVAADLKLSEPRSRLTGFTFGGYAFFAGGVNGVTPDDQYSDVVDIFNWKLQYVGSLKLSTPRCNIAAARIGTNEILAGGYTGSGACEAVDIIGPGSSPSPSPTPSPTDPGSIEYAFTSNSEVKTGITLPTAWTGIEPGRKIYPSDLAALPEPDATTTTVSGWFTDITGQSLVTDAGFTVLAGDTLTLYCCTKSSLVKTIAFDYIAGKTTDEKKRQFHRKINELRAARGLFRLTEDELDDQLTTPVDVGSDALDRTVLNDAEEDALPADPQVIAPEDTSVKLPTADEMPTINAGTSEERTFSGWSTEPIATESTMIPGGVLDASKVEDGQTVYAVYDKTEPDEQVPVDHKLAEPYSFPGDSIATSTHVADMTGDKLDEAAAAMAVPGRMITDPAVDPLDQTWTDYGDKGQPYTPPSPDMEHSENLTSNSKTYDDEIGDTPTSTDIISLEETPEKPLYDKFTVRDDVVLNAHTDVNNPAYIMKTIHINFAIDDANPDEDKVCPSNIQLPQMITCLPYVDGNDDGNVDVINLPQPEPIEGFKFEDYYMYDENGNKKIVDPQTFTPTTNVTLYPEYSVVLNSAEQTSIALVAITPDTKGVIDKESVPELAQLQWTDVPKDPFAAVGGHITITKGETFDPNTAIDLGEEVLNNFSIVGYYVQVADIDQSKYGLELYTPEQIFDPLTLYVAFDQKVEKQSNIQYIPSGDSDADNDIYAPAATLDQSSGNSIIDLRPAQTDVANSIKASDVTPPTTAIITSYTTDADGKVPFDPTVPVEEGSTTCIYPQMEQLDTTQFCLMTIDYVPYNINTTGSKFSYRLPLRSSLPPNQQGGTTKQITRGAPFETVVELFGDFPFIDMWSPKYDRSSPISTTNNPFWYCYASTTDRVPVKLDENFIGVGGDIIVFLEWEFDPDFSPELSVSTVVTTQKLNYARCDASVASTQE